MADSYVLFLLADIPDFVLMTLAKVGADPYFKYRKSNCSKQL